MRIGYKHTMYACYTGFIVQATINNFIPLLFVTFQTSYGIPLSQITFLVTFNFGHSARHRSDCRRFCR